MSTTHHRIARRQVGLAVAALSGLLAAGAAQAVDFGGYFRTGPGAPRKTPRAPATA